MVGCVIRSIVQHSGSVQGLYQSRYRIPSRFPRWKHTAYREYVRGYYARIRHSCFAFYMLHFRLVYRCSRGTDALRCCGGDDSSLFGIFFLKDSTVWCKVCHCRCRNRIKNEVHRIPHIQHGQSFRQGIQDDCCTGDCCNIPFCCRLEIRFHH